MVDVPDSLPAADARHLEGCAECQGRKAAAVEDSSAIATLLAVPEPKLNVSAALGRVLSAPDSRPRLGFRLPVLRPMSRPALIGLAAAFVAVGLLATVIANDYLFAYRPNSVTAVPVTVADMQSLSQLSQYGTVTWTTKPQLQLVNSAAEAQTASGLQPPVVSNLPSGVSTNVTYAAMTQAVAVFKFDAAKASAAVAASGKALPALPAGMDGAQLTVTAGPAVAEVFGNLKPPSSSSATQSGTAANSGITAADLPQLIVIESNAPSVTSTQVTPKQLESYLLSVPGLSPDLVSVIKALGNPSSTLPIPIPIQYATSTNVTVNGNPGVALGDNTGLGSGVIWVQNGELFAVAGTVKQSDVLNIANNLH
ncbi:MAG TPA: hypothetical protein VEW68_09425 [Patescibacteria group bacterium]|nr:hypothetical protein [Patescibacteria group bacterium]